jgi:hypothetical protein
VHRFLTILVIGIPTVAFFAAADSGIAFAGVGAVAESGGNISVGASSDTSFGGSPGAVTTSPVVATAPAPSSPSSPSSAPNPNAPICRSTVLTLNNMLGPPPGVTGPGSWYSILCSGPSGSTTQNLWISAATPGTPAPPAPPAPPVDPRTLALQAESQLQLPSPTVSFDPANAAVVNLPTWLWVSPAIWHPYSVAAVAGAVTATATATPVSVTWTMGDGGSVGCDGPGTVYQPQLPSSAQTTYCSYAYPVSSAGQPSSTGGPGHPAFAVTATVAWQVSWTAQGAAGGGTLPELTTAGGASLPVMQVESVNS